MVLLKVIIIPVGMLMENRSMSQESGQFQNKTPWNYVGGDYTW